MADYEVVVRSRSAFLRDDSGRFLAAVDAGATAAVQEIADAIAGLAIMFAPHDKGELQASIEPVTIAAHEAAAIATAPHAAAQELGASPHDIPGAFGRERPYGYGGPPWTNSPSAATPGQWHPGNPAVKYLHRAANVVAPMTPGILRKNMPG